MAKSVTEKKVRNHIPNDLAFSILSKLPLKPLKRFGCVCKTWALLFENSRFRSNFISISHSYYDDTSLLLHERVVSHDNSLHCSFYLLSGERYENQVKLDFPNLFQEENPFIDFYDCNLYGCDTFSGTLCLKRGKKLLLWNPTTHEFKAIPPSPVESVPPYRELTSMDIHGFGYDHIKEDFKIIRYLEFTRISSRHLERLDVRPEYVSWNEISYESEWEIYSLRCNSWRKLDVNMRKHCNVFSYEPLYIDGMSHWWSQNENYDEHFLVSFDLSNEMFFTTTIPIDIPSDIDTNFNLRLVRRRLVVLNRSIASISWYLYKTTFHISILGELGVKESWTKLFVVGPLLYVERLIGAGKNGDIFFQKKDGKLVCFSLSTQKTEELGVKEAYFYDIAIYKKSLLSIGGINH